MRVIIFLSIAFSSTAFGQTIEIKKIKGNKAGVVFDGVGLRPGDFVNKDIRVLQVKGNKAIVEIKNPDKYHDNQIIDYVGGTSFDDSSKEEVKHNWYLSPIVGVETGGDVVVEAESSGGDAANAKAGDGLLVLGGLRYNFNLKSHLQFNLGFKKGDEKYSNGKMDKSNIPLEFLWYYYNKKNNFRLGGGLSYHMANSLSIKIDGQPEEDINISDAFGFIVAGDYFFGKDKNILLGLRITSISYDVDPVILPGSLEIKDTLDASNFGIVFAYMHGL